MGFLAPLGLLGLLLLIPVIAMYLLKRRREEAVVSSTFLWERTLQDLEANAPWQKLRRNLLLLLQLIALTLLAIALARPFLRGVIGGQSLIVVLDSSVSMAARDVENGSRLDAAKREVLRLGDSLSGGRITVIRAGDGAELLVSNSNDAIALRQALEPVQPTARDSDLSQALTLAAAAAERQPESEIVVISDGAVQVPSVLATKRPVRFVPLGSSSANQAITLMTLEQAGDATTLLVGATNYDSQSITRRLSITIDDTSFSAKELDLPPGQAVSYEFDLGTLAENAVVEARLDGSDALVEDDAAWAVPGKGGANTARLLTPDPNSPYLRYLTVPLQLLLGSTVEVVQAGTPSDAASTDEAADLLVVNHWLPSEGLPGTTENLLILNPPAGNPVIEASGVFTNPIPLLTGAVPAVGQGISFEDDLFFVEARETRVPDWGTVVIEDGGNGQPLLWVGEQDGRRIAVLNVVIFGTPETLGLQATPSEALLTNFVFHPAYPLLMSRLVDYLAAGPAGNLAGRSVPPGESIALPLLGPRGVEVTTPSGTQALQPAEGARSLFFTPTEEGAYTVQWPGSTQAPVQFVANYFLPNESAIAPQSTLALTTSAEGTPATPDATAQEGRQPWWRPFAFIALLVLALEWLVYQKDAVKRLRQRLART